MTALDFSYARPGGTALKSESVTSVGRYLGTDGRCITLAELNDYLNNEISVWFIKENSSRGMLNGYPQGAADASAAQQQLNALGQPNAVVYFTADFDIQPSQFSTGNNYLKGVATVIPVTRIGLYAGIDYLNAADTLITYRWKTASSSFDHGQTPNQPLHLVQTTDAVPIPNTDYNIIMQADHGQTGTPPKPAYQTPQEDDMFKLYYRQDAPSTASPTGITYALGVLDPSWQTPGHNFWFEATSESRRDWRELFGYRDANGDPQAQLISTDIWNSRSNDPARISDYTKYLPLVAGNSTVTGTTLSDADVQRIAQATITALTKQLEQVK